MNEPLSRLVETRSILVCCGSGGVGKTTVAAAIALQGARLGRRTCVVTVDPARRLADSLGLEELPNTPARIPGEWAGELWGLMLDPKTTFDELVRRYSADAEQADRILSNRIYRNLTGGLSGTHEYMAMEKLFELHESGRFDLIVVDTPPTRNALDLIDAPRRLTRFLDNRLFRILMTPTRSYLRALGTATQTFLRTISRVVGAEVVDDVVAFFQAFQGMEQGFRQRATDVTALLASPSSALVMVASPRRDAVAEAEDFVDRLSGASLPVRALVVNRMHPRFTAPPSDGHVHPDLPAAALEPLMRNLEDLTAVAAREEAHLSSLVAKVSPAPVSKVALLAGDVHDLGGLEAIRLRLFG